MVIFHWKVLFMAIGIFAALVIAHPVASSLEPVCAALDKQLAAATSQPILTTTAVQTATGTEVHSVTQKPMILNRHAADVPADADVPQTSTIIVYNTSPHTAANEVEELRTSTIIVYNTSPHTVANDEEEHRTSTVIVYNTSPQTTANEEEGPRTSTIIVYNTSPRTTANEDQEPQTSTIIVYREPTETPRPSVSLQTADQFTTVTVYNEGPEPQGSTEGAIREPEEILEPSCPMDEFGCENMGCVGKLFPMRGPICTAGTFKGCFCVPTIVTSIDESVVPEGCPEPKMYCGNPGCVSEYLPPSRRDICLAKGTALCPCIACPTTSCDDRRCAVKDGKHGPECTIDDLNGCPCDIECPADLKCTHEKCMGVVQDGEDSSICVDKPGMIFRGCKCKPKPAEKLSCHIAKSARVHKFKAQEKAEMEFCRDVVKQGRRDKDSGAVTRSYKEKALDELTLALDFPSGRKVSHDECKEGFAKIFLECDIGDGFSSGGSYTIDDIKFRVQPGTCARDLKFYAEHPEGVLH